MAGLVERRVGYTLLRGARAVEGCCVIARGTRRTRRARRARAESQASIPESAIDATPCSDRRGRARCQPLAARGRGRHPPLLIIARDGRYFVVDDTCSHGAASLAEGELVGHELLCPHHRGGFDIRSGAPTRPPCAVAIGRYAVTIDDGMLYIDTP